MMDQQVKVNLYQYATIKKKSLIVSLLTSITSVILLVGNFEVSQDYIDPVAAALAMVILVLGLAIIIFYFQMLSRLSRAKNISQDRMLINAFNMRLASLFCLIISLFVSSYIYSVLSLLSYILSILVVKNIVDYILEQHQELGQGPGLSMISQGFRLYLYSAILDFGISVFLVFVSDENTMLILIIAVLGLILTIIGIYGQFKIANGMIAALQPFMQYGQYQGPGGQFQSNYGRGQPMGAMGGYPQGTQSPQSDQYSNTYRQPMEDSTQYRNPPPVYETQDYSVDDDGEDMVKCSYCNTSNKRDAKYCRTCGAPL